jgi:hypothetical protein
VVATPRASTETWAQPLVNVEHGHRGVFVMLGVDDVLSADFLAEFELAVSSRSTAMTSAPIAAAT